MRTTSLLCFLPVSALHPSPSPSNRYTILLETTWNSDLSFCLSRSNSFSAVQLARDRFPCRSRARTVRPMCGALERFVWSCVTVTMRCMYIRSVANCEQFRILNSTQALLSRASGVRLGNATNSVCEFEKRWSRHPKFLVKFMTVCSEFSEGILFIFLTLVLTRILQFLQGLCQSWLHSSKLRFSRCGVGKGRDTFCYVFKPHMQK
jgi:hypothetical protein